MNSLKLLFFSRSCKVRFLQLLNRKRVAGCTALSCPKILWEYSWWYCGPRCSTRCSSTPLPSTSSKAEKEARIWDTMIEIHKSMRNLVHIITWQRMNAWKSEDMWRTDVFDCSGNPEKITCMWSAMWQDTSWGIGCASGIVDCVGLLLLPVYIAMCVSDPNNNQDKSLMWPIQSTYSRALKRSYLMNERNQI